jgi:hypothetical protein
MDEIEAPKPWDVAQLHQMPEVLTAFDMAIDAVILTLGGAAEPNPDAIAWARRVIEHPGNRPKICLRAAMTARAHPVFVEAASQGTPPREIPQAAYVEVLVALLRVRGTEPVPDDTPPAAGVVR